MECDGALQGIPGLFVVRMDNNPLTYILTTPNLDATGHRWIGTLASFEFALEYQKGADNGAADSLRRVPISHDCVTVCSLLEGAIIGAAVWSEAEANEELLCEHVHLEDDARVQADTCACGELGGHSGGRHGVSCLQEVA